MSRMKSSRYLVISYFWAPRLLLRSRATGERETEKEKKKERETGPRPITSPVRVTGDRGRGRQAMGKKRTDLCFRPARLTSPLSFLSLSSSADSPFDSWLPYSFAITSPSLPSFHFLPSSSHSPPLLFVTLSSLPPSPCPSSTVAVNTT